MARIGLLIVVGALQSREDEDMVIGAAKRALDHSGYSDVTDRKVPNIAEKIHAELIDMSSRCDVVFTAGGVGFSPDDIVPEVTAGVLERAAPGIAELIRAEMHKHSEVSHLNRGMAGIRGKCVIINLPGTPETVKEGIQTLALLLRPMLVAAHGGEVVPGMA